MIWSLETLDAVLCQVNRHYCRFYSHIIVFNNLIPGYYTHFLKVHKITIIDTVRITPLWNPRGDHQTRQSSHGSGIDQCLRMGTRASATGCLSRQQNGDKDCDYQIGFAVEPHSAAECHSHCRHQTTSCRGASERRYLFQLATTWMVLPSGNVNLDCHRNPCLSANPENVRNAHAD